MPFTLAHPAAVLPLRRFCPRLLSFPALVAGSLSPDVGYVFGRLHVEEFAQRFAGSLLFCLPTGLLMVGAFYRLRCLGIGFLLERTQTLLRPLCQRHREPLTRIALSILLGAWTHQLVDAFTNKQGWMVQHLPVLRTVLFGFSGRDVRACRLLWYAGSFVGVAWLCLAYARWQQTAAGTPVQNLDWAAWRKALLVAMLVLPLGVVHHLTDGWLPALLVALSSAALATIAISRSPSKPPATLRIDPRREK